MNNAAIYPYTTYNFYMYEALCKHRPDLNITSLVIPKAFSKSIIIPNDVLVFDKIDKVIPTVDWIVFLPMWDEQRLYKEILMSIKSGKNIICTVDFPFDKITELKDAACKKGVVFETDESNGLFQKLKKRADVYTQQESVVIAVGSLTKGIDSSKYVLALSDKLADYGYRVSVIASNQVLSALGFSMMPVSKIIENNLDHTIVQINRLFNYVQLKQRPDIILVQLPDEGIYRISNDYETCFGAETYLVSQAVDIDYCIMLSPVIDADPETFDYLSEVSKSRYGFVYNGVCITHNIVDMGVAQGTEKMNYYIASVGSVKEVVGLLRENTTGDIIYFDSESDWYTEVANDIVNRCS